MKALFTLILVAAATLTSLAQNINRTYIDTIPQSNLERFSQLSGIMLKKENVRLGIIGGVGFEGIKITDVASGRIQAGLRLYTPDPDAAVMARSSVYLDADELPGLLNTVNYLIENIVNVEVPKTCIEYKFLSRSGVKFKLHNEEAAFSSKWKWYAYLGAYRSWLPETNLSVNDLSKLKSLLETATHNL